MSVIVSAQNPLIQNTIREKIRTGNHKAKQALSGLEKSVEASDVKLSDNTDLDEGEPYIAINPADSLNIVISYMAFSADGELDFPVYNSFDGGESWALSNYNALSVLPPNGLIVGGGDPLLAFDNNGRLYFGYLYFTAANFLEFLNPDFIVYWAYSDDGGLNFEVPNNTTLG